MKQLLVLSLLCLISCDTNEAGYTPPGVFTSNQYTYEVSTKVFKNGIEDLRLVNFFHGAGKDVNKIFISDNRQVFGKIDSVFYLPFNIKSDTSVFCFERKDLSKDTIWLGYNRVMTTGWSHEVYMALRGIKILKCSSGIFLDSSSVSQRNDLRQGEYKDLKVELKIKLR